MKHLRLHLRSAESENHFSKMPGDPCALPHPSHSTVRRTVVMMNPKYLNGVTDSEQITAKLVKVLTIC